MKDTLRDRYGVDQHEEFNRAVTHAWDKAQERVSHIMTKFTIYELEFINEFQFRCQFKIYRKSR